MAVPAIPAVTRNTLNAIPYKKDDLPQAMARILWLPMLVMGLMAVGVGLAAGSLAGLEIGDFFAGDTPDALGRGQATAAWASGVTFLGMAFILSSITMVLVNILRTIRDTGRDVQQAVGAASVLQLKKPFTGVMIPHVMMMGLMSVVVAFGVSVVRANLLGGLPGEGLANPATLRGENLADLGAANAIGAWIGPLNLTGLAIIFVSIVLALRTIIKSLTFSARRIQQLAVETWQGGPWRPGLASETARRAGQHA